MTVGKFFLGLIIAIVGFLIVWKSEWLMQNFGRIGWAEQHISTEGGSRLLYKTIGTIIILAGFMIATDLTETFFRWVATAIFGAKLPE